LGIWLRAGVLIGKATLKAAAKRAFRLARDWQRKTQKNKLMKSSPANCKILLANGHYILTIIYGTSFIISAQNQLQIQIQNSIIVHFLLPSSLITSLTGNPRHLLSNFRCVSLQAPRNTFSTLFISNTVIATATSTLGNWFYGGPLVQ